MSKLFNFYNENFEFVVLMSVCLGILFLFAVDYIIIPQLNFSFLSFEKPLVMIDYTMLNNLPFAI